MHPAVAITAALAGLFSVTIAAVIFSKNANTAGVFTGAGTALAQVISAAVSPVTGNATNTGAQTTNQFGSTLTSPNYITQAG